MRRLVAAGLLLVVIGSVVWVLAAARLGITRTDSKIGSEIVGILPSPDYKAVALFLTGSRDRPVDSVAVFDMSDRRITVSGRLADMSSAVWSHDSRFLAIDNSDSMKRQYSILLIDRTTGSRLIPLTEKPDLLMWREDEHERLMYRSGSRQEHVIERTIGTGEERSWGFPGLILSLFNVRGVPYVSYQNGRGNGYDRSSIYIAEVESGREILRVPLFETADWDLSRFEVSPDGKAFFLSAIYSGGTRHVLGLIEDIPTVFRRPREALMWQDGTFEAWDVRWLRPSDPRRGYSSRYNQALVYPDTGPVFLMDLTTGSRFFPQVPDSRSSVIWALEKLQPGTFADVMLVSDNGLEFHSADYEVKPRLLLRHRPILMAPTADQ